LRGFFRIWLGERSNSNPPGFEPSEASSLERSDSPKGKPALAGAAIPHKNPIIENPTIGITHEMRVFLYLAEKKRPGSAPFVSRLPSPVSPFSQKSDPFPRQNAY